MEFSQKSESLFQRGLDQSVANISNPSLIRLSIGNPPPEGFPVERIRKISDRLLKEEPYSLLNYSSAGGRSDLKEEVRKFLNRRPGMEVVHDKDLITITNGGQQAIALAADLFCNEGDVVLCESPTFMAAIDTLRSQGVILKGVKMEDDGISLEDLERKMQENPKPKLLYVIPDFQNPTGISLPAYKRQRICELAYEYDVPVLEDNPYYELRYDGEFIPFLKCFDRHGMVALTSSMSKIVAPGMRTGYVVAPEKMGEGFALFKSAVDLHVPTWSQRMCCELLKEGMEPEIAELRKLYGHRGRLSVSILEKTCHPDVRFTRPQGGMFIWVTLPDRADIGGYLRELLEQKVDVVPGNSFFAEGGKNSHSFRISYSMATEEQIRISMETIGKLTWKYC